MAANTKNNKTEYQTELLLEKLEEYSKENSDFSVFCRNGKEVKSSKMLLASRSEYFSEMFKNYPYKSHVVIEDLEYSTMAFIKDSLIKIDLRWNPSSTHFDQCATAM